MILPAGAVLVDIIIKHTAYYPAAALIETNPEGFVRAVFEDPFGMLYDVNTIALTVIVSAFHSGRWRSLGLDALLGTL